MSEAKQFPANEYAYWELSSKGLIEYGISLTWDETIPLFGTKDRDCWEFRGEWMKFTAKLQELGFIVTERGMNGLGWRIMKREEMADHVRRNEVKKADDSLRKSLCLSSVPRESLSDSDVKKLDHWETKSAVIGATTKLLLRKRALPRPSEAISLVHRSATDRHGYKQKGRDKSAEDGDLENKASKPE